MKLKPFLICAFAFLTLATQAQTCTSIPSGLISWWRAETNALDIVSVNHGTPQNGASFTAGRVGQAFDFDGINDFVDIPHADSLNPSGPFSVETWVNANPSQLSLDGLFVIADKSHGFTDNTGWLLQGNATERIGFGYGNGSGITQVTTTSIVTDGLWHHVVGVYTGSELRIYYDGVLQGTVAASGTPVSNERNVSIGRSWGGGTPGRYFRGKVDELTFYQSALSGAEVAALFAAGASGKCFNNPYFMTRTLTDGRVGVPYYKKLEVTLTPGPYTFEVIAGTPPSGLSVSSAGILLGTPAAAGTSAFTVRSTDSLSHSSDQPFSLTVDSVPCTPIPPGMIAWWRGEGDARDELGRRHGILRGDVTFEPGMVGQAFHVNAINGYIEIPHDPLLSIGAAEAVSIEFWVKTAQVTSVPVVIDKRINPTDSSTSNYTLYKDRVRIAWGPTYVDFQQYGIGGGDWTHVVTTWQSSEYKVYLNGQLRQTASGTLGPENAAPLIMGNYWGLLDEVAFYDRALSAAEVSALHAAVPGGKCKDQLFFPPGELRAGKVSVPYLQRLGAGVTAGPLAFSLVSGILPPGLELISDGSIEGTPVTPGTHPLRFRVADAFGNAVEKDYALTVADGTGGPVAWWPADGNMKDAIGTNHGSGGPLYSDDGHGGGAFNGFRQNNWVTVPHSEELSFSPTTPMTVEFRGKQGGNHHLISKGGADFNYRLFPGTAPASLQWGGTGGGGAQSAGGIWQYPGNWVYWSHIVVTFDGTISKFYVDGVRSGTSTLGPLGPENTEPLQLMRRPGEYNGDIEMDDIAFYDRALSTAEVANLYVTASVGEPRSGTLYISTTSPASPAGQGLAYSQALQSLLGLPPYTYSVAEGPLPAGLSLADAGVLSGTPTGFGMYRFAIKVTDSIGHEATRKFGLDINGKPVLPAQPDVAVDELAMLTVTNAGSDPYPPGDTLSYALVAPPAGAAIDADGIITWTPTEAQGPGVYTITTQVTDDGTPSLSTTNSVTVSVSEVNLAPSLAVTPDATIDEVVAYSATATATDSDLPANTLAYELVSGPGGLIVSPAGAINWTPGEAQGPGVFPVTVRVFDNGSPSLGATQTFTLAVSEVNVAPLLTVPASATIDELVAYSATATATDADLPANALTFERVTGPTGLTVSPAGAINWIPDEAQGPGVFPVSVRVFDDSSPSLSATQTFTLTVSEVNSAPLLATIGDRTIAPGQTLTVTASASDGDEPTNGVVFALLTFPTGAGIHPLSGVLDWRATVGLADTTNPIVVRVSDNGTPSLSATQTFTVTVSSLTPVTLTALGQNNGQFRFEINGGVGPDHTLEGSTNLTDWLPLITTTPTNLPYQFIDFSVGTFNNRSYRVRLGP